MRLCGSLGHHSLKMVLGTPLTGFNPGKLPLFVADWSRRRHDGTNLTIYYMRLIEAEGLGLKGEIAPVDQSPIFGFVISVGS